MVDHVRDSELDSVGQDATSSVSQQLDRPAIADRIDNCGLVVKALTRLTLELKELVFALAMLALLAYGAWSLLTGAHNGHVSGEQPIKQKSALPAKGGR